MDKQYEILDHPADLKIKAFGKDLPEVFINLALGLASQQLKDVESEKVIGQYQKIIIQSDNLQSLLVDWLNEILYQGEINQRVYLDFKILNFLETKIEAEMAGLRVEEKLIEIKAATYHDLEIKKADERLEAVVVFDI